MTARDRIVIVVVLILAAVAGSWILVIQPKRQEASQLDQQVSAQQSQLNSARALLAQGQIARAAYQNNFTQLARLGEAVPADDEVPSLIYELQSAAKGARIDFRGVQVSTSNSSSSSTPAPGASSTLPPGVAMGTSGFPTEQFTFTFHGTFFELSSFLKRVHQFVRVSSGLVTVSGRLLSLGAITLGAGPKGFPQITATISATAFLMPATPAVSSGSGASAPPTTTASTGSSPAAASAAVPAATITPSAQ
jgi:type II secretory pathway pseudopilin PulG